MESSTRSTGLAAAGVEPSRRRPLLLPPLLLLLLIAARQENCTFSLGPNGLCAGLRLDPQDLSLRVGQSLRIRINAEGCPAAAPCPCADSAMAGVRWRSTAPATASVDSDGVIAGLRPGATEVILLPASLASWRRTRVQVIVAP